MKITAKHIWTVPCQKSTVDAETNTMSLFEVIERLEIGLDPVLIEKQKKGETDGFVIPIGFEIVSYWKKLSKKGAKSKEDAQLVVIDSEGKQIAELSMEITIPANIGAMRMRARLTEFKVTSAGMYTIEVQHKVGSKFEVVAELPLEVVIHENSQIDQLQ